jgi:hypothetical protein
MPCGRAKLAIRAVCAGLVSQRRGKSMIVAVSEYGRGTTMLPRRVSGTYTAQRPAGSVALIACGMLSGSSPPCSEVSNFQSRPSP